MKGRIGLILRLATYSPVTSQDVAEATKIPLKQCSAYLTRLYKQGRLERSKMPAGGFGVGRAPFVYQAKEK